jgi:hypothetical protein
MVLNEDTIIELQLTKEQKSARLGREVVQGILTADQAREMLYPELVEINEGESEGSNDSDNGDTVEGDPAAEAANAQAQANLRGSVGGVQGIIGILDAVTAGRMSRDSATATLIQIYGFDLETVNDILG